MTLTEVDKILTELGLFKVDSKFPDDYDDPALEELLYDEFKEGVDRL